MPFLPLLAGAVMAVGQYFIWMYAPVEETMGIVQKIFYMHMPMAWWSLVSFFVVFVASILFLAKKTPFWDHLAGASAEIGVVLSSLALITGSLWARPIWNVWWTWDPRLTTTLIMWFVYVAYLLVRSADVGGERRGTISAVLGIVAFLDVPLVFLSARYWRSIHPAVLGSKSGGMEPEMWTTLIVCLIGWGLLWSVFLIIRTKLSLNEAKVGRLALKRFDSA